MEGIEVEEKGNLEGVGVAGVMTEMAVYDGEHGDNLGEDHVGKRGVRSFRDRKSVV